MPPEVGPEDLPAVEDFKDCVVAFVDILGFDKKVRSIENDADFFEVGRIMYAAQQTAAGISDSRGVLEDFTITAISDSIIVSVPYSSPVCTVGLLQILQNFQYELIATGLKTLVRGFIDRGPMYHKDGLVFGAGYSDAYHGEGNVGGAPRIVLSPKLVEDGRQKIADTDTTGKITAFDYLREDTSDGFFFVDYFRPNGIQQILPKDQLREERTVIKEFIDTGLQRYAEDYRVLPKYKWLRNYCSETAIYYGEEA